VHARISVEPRERAFGEERVRAEDGDLGDPLQIANGGA